MFFKKKQVPDTGVKKEVLGSSMDTAQGDITKVVQVAEEERLPTIQPKVVKEELPKSVQGFKRERSVYTTEELESSARKADLAFQEVERQEAERVRAVQAIFTDTFLSKVVEDMETTTITDIRFNGTTLRVQCNERGRYSPEYQPTRAEVLSLIRCIANIQGHDFTDTEPILDTENGGVRVSATHQLISPSGPSFALRISRPILAIQDFSKIGPIELGQLLYTLVRANTNVVIAGITGSGKTELQKYLVGGIDDDYIIVLMEDTMDSHLKQLYPNKDITSWRTQTQDNREKKIYYKDLMKASLRNNPEWAIISEMRDDEAYYVLQVSISGHNIMTTVHTESAWAIPTRIVDMITDTRRVDGETTGRNVVRYLPLGIHMVTEIKKGKIERYISEVAEFTGYHRGEVQGNALYKVTKTYDPETNTYTRSYRTGRISMQLYNKLVFHEVAHLLPEMFVPKEIMDKSSA